ncbi:ABC transporter substrate-binding protein [Paenibacillus sp. FSL W7-1287]|uniref:ABC transporter substrate-binding protein n=1 Tax=Paenibacillus sp. FSL W7-1287 TaxID=2954538 RepID=UPI0030FC5E1B
MKKWMKTSLAVCMSAALLAGCSFGSKGNSGNETEPSTLKVMYYDESSFFSEYGMVYSAVNPDVEIEVVNTSKIYERTNDGETDYNEAYLQFIEEEKPDVIMIEPSQLTSLGDEGKLYDIENFVNEEKYNAAGLVPGLVDSMKNLGNGKLYGIPTSFYSQVIYYNKDLFDEYGVPYPTDQMSWAQIIDLAKMFPTDGEYPDRVYGLKMGWGQELSEIVNTLSQGENLQMFNADTLQMTIDTPAWNSLVETAISVMNSNSLFYDSIMWENEGAVSRMDYYARDPFYAGKLAMRLDGNYLLQELENLSTYAENPDDLIQNWDIVTAPVSSSNPEESSYINYQGIFAINSQSTNIEQAWNFISYITGDEYARVKSKVSYGNMPLRSTYMKKDDDRNYDAFYKVRPSTYNNSMDYTKVPQIFQFEFYSLMQTELAKVSSGETTVAEALSTLQIKGDELLAQGMMSQEEMDKYWEDKYGEGGGMEVLPMDVVETEEIAEEEVVEE